jgi:methylated-DNA-[protein]-cysteine S-methyltransferase
MAPEAPEAWLTALRLARPEDPLGEDFGEDFGGDSRVSLCERLLADTAEQLEEYFAQKRQSFEIPLKFLGSAFQVRVWGALSQIRYGQTWSYSQLADTIHLPRGARAVGAALGKNPLWIVVPCHRVLGQSGQLVGFAGGLDTKRYLIELEKNRAIG